jgi:beta-galactosidase
MRLVLLFFCAMVLSIQSGVALQTVREDRTLDSGWRFKPGDEAGAELASLDDQGWGLVRIPHNWGWEKAQNGEDYYRGPGWYRYRLVIAPSREGRRYFLRFGAASLVADVYLNGTLLGQHRGGFGAFAFEITGHLAADGENLLAVRVSNERFPDIAPLSGDFSVFGGLYRPVRLIVTDTACFAVTDHGSPGIVWRQTKISTEQATLDVTAQVSNAADHPVDRLLVARVYDATGMEVAHMEQAIRVAPRITAPYYLRVPLVHPHLWNGRKDPYLYSASAELRGEEGIVLDRIGQPLGLRFYRVDPQKGFFLNGEPYHLHGVNRHQDRPDKGWAISEADMREDLDLINELGATVVRCAHYQHSEYFYSLCDSAGILVWAELPQVDEIAPGAQFAETSRGQLLDLIRQNINHPSIFVWSLFNELWPGRPDPHRELQDLVIVAHGEDPSRPTIAATSHEQYSQMNKIPDLLGWNMYPGWYGGWGSLEDFGRLLDERQETSREGGFCVSEYGAGANVTHHELHPKQPKTDGPWHPEEWQAIVHESDWAALKARPFVWGTFVWNMFDFTSASRHEGGIPGRNDKGLVTYDRETRKDAFYFYKVNWSTEGTVYITSRRFAERTEPTTPVKVYSNGDRVELFVNGMSQGTKRVGTDGVFLWDMVTLRPGRNEIEARAVKGSEKLVDRCVWTLSGTVGR